MQIFKTKLVRMGEKGAWTCLKLPFDVPKVFGTKARMFVRGKINGSAFRTSIFPMSGEFMMMVNKSMQASAAVKMGDTVLVEMEKVDRPPPLRIPAVLQRALRQQAQAKALFAKMSYSCRKEHVDWITSAKQEETRQRRIQKVIALIKAGNRSNK